MMMQQYPPEEDEEETLDQASDENNELQKLEEDVKLMTQKIAEFREIWPDQLHNTLSSILSAHRPTVNLNHSDNDHGPSTTQNSESGALVEDDPAHAEKLQMIKQKISSNASAMFSVSKRMKDCMSRINNLDSVNNEIHPAFIRRKITSENCFL